MHDRLSELDKKSGKLTEEFSQSKLDSLANGVEILIQDHKVGSGSLKDGIAELKSDLHERLDVITNLKSDLNERLAETLNNLNSRLDDLSEELKTESDGSRNDLAAHMISLKDEIGGLESKLEDLKSDLDGIRVELEELRG